jgi:hypothetical protein
MDALYQLSYESSMGIPSRIIEPLNANNFNNELLE